MMNKRGSFLDLIFVIVTLLGAIFATVYVLQFNTAFYGNVAVQKLANQSDAGRKMTTFYTQTYPNGYADTIIVGSYVIYHIGVIILAVFIPVSMLFLVFHVLTLFFGVLLSSWAGSMAIPVAQGYAGSIPMTWWLINHLVSVELAFAALTIVVTFLASRNSGGSSI